MHNSYTNNDNQNSEQNNTTLNEVNNMSNQNTNTAQHEVEKSVFDTVLDASLKPRSSVPSKFEALNAVLELHKGTEDGMFKKVLLYEIYEARLKIARALLRDLDVAACCDNNPYVLAMYIERDFSALLQKIREGKKNKKPTVSKAITHAEAVEYARALTEGYKNRSSGVARDLKSAALLIAYRNSNNALDSEDVDKALDKVYAAVRRQGKKNEVDLGGKSNKPTKEAAKAAILEVLLRMINGHEYEFSVIIGEC